MRAGLGEPLRTDAGGQRSGRRGERGVVRVERRAGTQDDGLGDEERDEDPCAGALRRQDRGRRGQQGHNKHAREIAER